MTLEDKIKELDEFIEKEKREAAKQFQSVFYKRFGRSPINSEWAEFDYVTNRSMARNLKRALLALEEISDCGTPLIEMYAHEALREILKD